MMRSAARLTYNRLQRASDGAPDDELAPLMDSVVTPLYGAFAVLLAAREKRGALDLDLPERLVRLGDDGRIAEIGVRERLDSHKLIEEFMVLANVAAAQALEQRHTPCLYRVHDQPDAAKLEALREFLGTLGIAVPVGQRLRPADLNRVLHAIEGKPVARLVNETILRSQSQAVYSPNNLGHFGLALARYAHFTSPIRRFPDLIVHRALISAYGLGEGGLPAGRQGPLRGVRRASVDVRAPRRRRRTRRHGPLCRGLYGGPCRRHLRRPGHLGDALRPVRRARRHGRRRADPDPQPRPGILPPRRRPPDADRRAHRRDLRAGRPAAR